MYGKKKVWKTVKLKISGKVRGKKVGTVNYK
jgi:hypothetical protein